MHIGVAGLVGHLVDAVADLKGLGAEEVPERMRCNGMGVGIEDPIDLPAAQPSAPAADKEIRAAGVRPLLQILPNRIDHLIADEDNPGLIAFPMAD